MSEALAAAARADPALAAVVAFTRRFGPETTALAMHAALPLGLSPELVHLLRVNFVRHAPFIAEADLLLSPLCTEVGGGMYEMDADVRELLLGELAASRTYGPAHVRRVARFLRVWAARALDDSTDPDAREHLRVQQWVALAYEEPARAAEELAGALRAGVEAADRPEVARVARLTTVLSAPLAAQVELRRYVGAVERVATTGSVSVRAGTGDVPIGRERLPALDRVIRLWQPPTTPPGPDIQQQANVAEESPIQQQAEVAEEPVIQQQANVVEEPPIQQQANVEEEPAAYQQAETSSASALPTDGRYRVAKVVVLGDAGVGKTTLVRRVSRAPSPDWGPTEGLDEAPTEGITSTRWVAREGASGEGGLDVVFTASGHGPMYSAELLDAAAVLLVAAGPGSLESTVRWLGPARTGTHDRPVVVAVRDIPADTWDSQRAELESLAREHSLRTVLAVDAAEGVGIAELQRALVEAVDWHQQPTAESRQQVDWLESRLREQLRSSPVAPYDESFRGELAAGLLRARGAEAALDTIIACVVVRDVVRLAGDPPWAIVRADAYRRCLAEVWQAAGALEHDRPGLPSVPLPWLEQRFSAPEFQGFLNMDPTPGVLDLVLEDLVRRRWGYLADTRRGSLVVIPSLMRHNGLEFPSQWPSILHVRWPGQVFDIFVYLLVHLADVGAPEVLGHAAMQMEFGGATIRFDAGMAVGVAQITLSSRETVENLDELQALIGNVVSRYVPAGAELTIVRPEEEPTGHAWLEPPTGVDLAQACLVVLPHGTRQVGERVVDFDALWEHLFKPAVADTRLPEGGSLVPVRISELPPPGTPLPEWTKAARLVAMDVTGLDAPGIRARATAGFRPNSVVLFADSADLPDDIAVYLYVSGTPEELALQRSFVSVRLAAALRAQGEEEDEDERETKGPGAKADVDPKTQPRTLLVALVAPRSVRAGDHLRVATTLYSESTRESVEEKLKMTNPELDVIRATSSVSIHDMVHLRINKPWAPATPEANRLAWMGTSTEFVVEVPAEAAGTKQVFRLEMRVGSPSGKSATPFSTVIRWEVEVLPGSGGAEAPPPRTVYVSCAPEDRMAASERIDAMWSAGMDVFDMDEREVPDDDSVSWSEEVCSRDLFVLFWSDAAAKSRTVAEEWQTALKCNLASGRPLIEVEVLDEAAAESIPPELRPFQTNPTRVDLAGPGERLSDDDPRVRGPFDVVLTFSGVHRHEVREIAEGLYSRGITPWFDQWSRRPGQPLLTALAELVGVVPCVVAVIGAGIRVFQQREMENVLTAFARRGATIIPVVVGENSDPILLPETLGSIQAIDFSRHPDPIGELARVIQERRPAEMPGSTADGAEFTVMVDMLNVRSGPDSSSTVLGTVPKGTVVTPVAEQNGWRQIIAPVSGWVRGQFLQYVGEQFTVTAKTLNVRSGPSPSNPAVGTITTGTVVTAVAEQGGWKQIISPLGGWVNAQFLQPVTDVPASAQLAVAISSTLLDLPEYRTQVFDACLRVEMVPQAMEALPAQSGDAVQAALAMIDRAAVYIGVFAHRYGYIPEGYEKSISEMEYERAVERGIPRLIYIMDDDAPIAAGENDFENQAKMDAFKERLKKEERVAIFWNPPQLGTLVIQNLILLRTRL